MLCWHAVRTSTLWWLCSLCLLVFFSGNVRAEPPPEPASPPSAYEPLIEQALEAYEAGRYAEARNTFRRAHELHPTARTLRGMGMCSFNLGDYTHAAYELEQALKEPRLALTAEQQAHARGLIDRANRHIGRFHLRLTPAEAALRVDGDAPLIVEGRELLLDAGTHEIEVRAPGFLTAHSSVKVEGGDRTTLVFRLLRDDYAVAASVEAPPRGPARSASPSAQPAAASGSWLRTLGYTSLGVGVASLLGFAVTGTLALADGNKLQDRCPNEQCSEMYRTTVRRYDTMRTLATITLVAGGALTVLGTGLLIAQPSSYSGERAVQRPSPTIEPVLGFGAVGLKGNL